MVIVDRTQHHEAIEKWESEIARNNGSDWFHKLTQQEIWAKLSRWVDDHRTCIERDFNSDVAGLRVLYTYFCAKWDWLPNDETQVEKSARYEAQELLNWVRGDLTSTDRKIAEDMVEESETDLRLLDLNRVQLQRLTEIRKLEARDREIAEYEFWREREGDVERLRERVREELERDRDREKEQILAMDKVRIAHLEMQEAERKKKETNKAEIEALCVLTSVEKRADDAYVAWSNACDKWHDAKKRVDKLTRGAEE